MPLHVLGITFDGGLAQPLTEKKYSGAQRRHLHYATKVEEYIMIARRYQSSVPASVRLTDNMQIYTTATYKPRRFITEAYQLGLELAKFHPFNLISAGNPHEAGLVGYLLKRKLGIPLNLHIKEDIIDNPYFLAERRINSLYNIISKWLMKKADSIRVTTEREFNKLSAYPDLPQLWNIPSYVNISAILIHPTKDWRAQLLGDSHRQLVLGVGRLIEQNDPFTFLEAAARVKQCNAKALFVWAGDGPLREAVENKIELLGLQDTVRLLGRIPFKEIPELYQSADIFASTPMYDGTGRALNEAAVTGRPLVATRYAGALDLIENGVQGYRVPIKDGRQMGNRICKMLENEKELKKMGREAGQRSLMLYNKKAIIEKYLKMWQVTANVDTLKTELQAE